LKGKWLFISIAVLLGCLYGLYGSIFIPAFFLFYLLFLKMVRKFSTKHLFYILGFFLLFATRAGAEETLNQTQLTGSESDFTLTLEEPMKLDGNFFSAYGVDAETKEKLVIQYRLSNIKEKEEVGRLRVGSTCKVKGELKVPEPPRNPNAFHYANYLRHEKIFWILKAKEVNSCTQENSPLIFIQNIRKKGIQYIHTHFPTDTAPLASALVFGDRSSIEEDLITAYQRLGIVHLLAISGLHVGMLVGILFYVGIRVGIPRERMTNFLIAFLPVYIILTGGAPSVIRACFMMILALLLSKIHQSKLHTIDILSIVFVVYVFLQPYVIFDIGFQLSFLVTFSLLLSSPIIAKYTLKPVHLLLSTSLISQLASIPILLYHFYEFSLSSLLVNVLYIPLFSVIILPTLLVLYLLHMVVGNTLYPLLSFVDFCLSLLNESTLFLAKFPFNTLVLGRPDFILLFLYCMGIPYSLYRWEKAKTIKQFAIALLVPFILLFFHYATGKMNPNGEVTMIDVGQGDSILIKLPLNQGTYLIDTGGTMVFPSEEWEKRRDPFEVGKDILVPFLKSKGITKLDKLILTHGDMDHMGGASAVLQNLTVKEVVLPDVKEKSELESNVVELCEKEKIPIRYGKKGDGWRVNDFSFRIMSPGSNDHLERNDQSIVLYTVLGGKRWLFTGDLEATGENKLVSSFPKLTADILKAGHHGSKTSTSEELLDHIHPKAALISAGVNNRFGHPHQEVTERLEQRKIKVFRTDLHGAVTYQFKGKRGTFFTELHTMKQRGEYSQKQPCSRIVPNSKRDCNR